MVLPSPTVVSQPYTRSGTTAQWSCPDLQPCLTPTQALALQPSGLALTYSRVSALHTLWYYSPVVMPWPTVVSHPICRLWYYSAVVLPWQTAVSHPYAGSGTTAQWSCPDLQSCLSPTHALVLQLSGLALTYSRVSPLRRLWYYSPVVLPWPTVVSYPCTASGSTAWQYYSPVVLPWPTVVSYPCTASGSTPWQYYSPVVLPWPTVVSYPCTASGSTAIPNWLLTNWQEVQERTNDPYFFPWMNNYYPPKTGALKFYFY